MKKRGYWFGGNTLPNGDGRRIHRGAVLKVDPPIALCHRGLHYSTHPLDALRYATTNQLWLIEDVGETVVGDNKCCTTARKHLAKIDAEPTLRGFTRWCALRVIHLWDAPEVVVRYLKTGDESIRAAARAAAGAAARAAAGAAARAAAGAAAGAAARAAAGAAARAAARAAAGSAAWAAAGDAARAAAWDAAGDAARAAAWDAARAVAWDAARAAAGAAAMDAHRKKLKKMIDGAFLEVMS